jgi:hypothetical protein
MQVWKKFSAVALALVMSLALCAPAFAADNTTEVSNGTMTNEDGVLGEFDNQGKVKNIYTTKDVLLYKEIKVYNKDEATVNAPTITYNYAVTPGTASSETTPITIKDKFNVPVEVKEGITANVAISGATTQSDSTWSFKTGKLEFTPSVSLDASETGTNNRFPIKVDFSKVVFTGAGVYRYIITETVEKTDGADETAKNAAGIADGSISNVRYLDVYVKDADDASTKEGAAKYDIYGFVCFQNLNENKIDGTEDNNTPTTNNNLTKVAKTEGFVADKGWDSTENKEIDLTADAYYTFNVTVSKTLVNDQAMKDHDFPFNVNFKNTSVTAAIVIKTKTSVLKVTDVQSTVTPAQLSSGNLSAETTGIDDNPKIDDGSNVKYIGIPVGITAATTVTVYETNDVTGTTYNSKYKVDTEAESEETIISWISTGNANKSGEAKIENITMNQADNTAHTIAFTNTLVNISPTGVTLRYAPYLAMMGAGIVALPLSLRKKEEEI